MQRTDSVRLYRVALIFAVIAFGLHASDAFTSRLKKTNKRWLWCDYSQPEGYNWTNNFDGDMKFSCADGRSISYMRSIYRSCQRDRIWSFSCQSNKAQYSDNGVQHSGTYSCATTDYVNDWDAPLFYMCPHNGVISGLESKHDNNKEDRRFKIKCCRSDEYITYDCTTSSYINDLRQLINYNVPLKHVMVGLFSYHDNNQEDRLWKVQICRVQPK